MADFHTVAFAAQDAVTAALQDASALSAWETVFGIPPVRAERHIWIDEQVDQWAMQPDNTGGRSEGFTLHVYFYARTTGATAAELRETVRVAAGVLESIMAEDLTLGGTVMFAFVAGAEYDGAFADAEGRSREGVLRLDLNCSAYLA